MDAVSQVPHVDSWKDYLPSVLQLPLIYWTIAICIAAICSIRTLPIKFRAPWMVQLYVFAIALFNTIPLMWPSFVYSVGTALICTGLSTTFYDVAMRSLVERVYAFFGIAQPNQTPDPQTKP